MHRLTQLLPLTLTLASLLLGGCASVRKPCSAAGDTSWYNGGNAPLKFGGDKKCEQKKQRDGTWIDDGAYREFYKNGTLALEGRFAEGVKDGKWIQYDRKGERAVERVYEKGVEKSNIPVSKTKGIKN